MCNHITPEEYLKRHSKTYGMTIEEASQTAICREFAEYFKEQEEADGNTKE